MPDYIQYNDSGLIISRWKSVDPSVVQGKSNILEVARPLFDQISKYSKVVNGALTEMTAQEKSAEDLKETNKLAAEEQKLLDIRNDLKGLKLSDQTVDFLINSRL